MKKYLFVIVSLLVFSSSKCTNTPLDCTNENDKIIFFNKLKKHIIKNGNQSTEIGYEAVKLKHEDGIFTYRILNDSKEYISISHDGLFYWVFKTDVKNNEKVFTETKDYDSKLGMEIREKVDAHFCELMETL